MFRWIIIGCNEKEQCRMERNREFKNLSIDFKYVLEV